MLEDRVEIGAGCTINKGVSGDTIIGAGTKLDSQVHIGHDAVIGKNCLLAGQVGVAGNTTLGDGVVLFGQVGIAQNLKIGDKAVVLAMRRAFGGVGQVRVRCCSSPICGGQN